MWVAGRSFMPTQLHARGALSIHGTCRGVGSSLELCRLCCRCAGSGATCSTRPRRRARTRRRPRARRPAHAGGGRMIRRCHGNVREVGRARRGEGTSPSPLDGRTRGRDGGGTQTVHGKEAMSDPVSSCARATPRTCALWRCESPSGVLRDEREAVASSWTYDGACVMELN